MIFSYVLALLAGVGVFIAGMNMLGDGLEKSAGSGMKRLLGKISNNRFAGVGIGAAVTAIIQSSSATSVMTIGFVNAGVMTLFQAASIIMGANIGTTITGIIVSLSSLDISLYASALAFVGVMMTFFKKDNLKRIGGILCGFGLLFIGLDLMSAAFGNQTVKDFFASIFVKLDFPLLLILVGAVFTALIQSSSAATGMVIIMVGQGAITVDAALFIVLGSNIGTCVTALLACIGTTANAKRTAVIHLTFNVVGTIVFAAFLWPFSSYMVRFLQGLLDNTQMQIAWFHVIFNVTTTLLLLPFIKYLVRFSMTVIPDKNANAEQKKQLRFVDERLLKTPPIALMQVKKEMEYMSALAYENIEKSTQELCGQAEEDYTETIYSSEEIIDFTNKSLTRYLIKLSPLVGAGDERVIGSYFHVLNDVERIGDHAENFHEIATQMQGEGLRFSDAALGELRQMRETILHMYDIAREAFESKRTDRLSELTALENEVDAMKRSLSANHFARLAEGKCTMEVSAYFFSIIAGLERVADHLINVGYSVLNPTGSQSEARAAGEIPAE